MIQLVTSLAEAEAFFLHNSTGSCICRGPAYARSKRTSGWLNAKGGSGFHGDEVWRMRRVAVETSGRLLDGREWNELPNAYHRMSLQNFS